MTKNCTLKLTGALKKVENRAGIEAVTVIAFFLILNALKITLFNYYIIPSQTEEIFKYKFRMSILLALAIYPLILRIKSRIFFIAVYILQTVYILANISYYLYYHNYLHILQWFTLFDEGFTAVKSFAAPISFKLLVVLVDFPAFIYIAINFYRIYNARKKRGLYRLLIVITSISMIASIELNNYNAGSSIIQFVNDRYKGESLITERYGTAVNEVTSLLLKGNEKQMISSFEYGKALINEKAAEDKPNFIIIQVESMDANVANQKYDGDYIAPYLHSLTEQAVYYPYAMSYHKGGSTSDAEFSTINSLEPLDGFPALKLSNYSYPNSMLYRLVSSSYKTVAFHGNLGSFFNRDTAFPKMGFEEFYDMLKMGMKDVGWGAPDQDVFNFAAKTIKTLEQPYLSYIITMTSHGPFTNARNYYNNSRYDDIKDETVRNYFNSISYVDQSIKNFVTDIKASCKNTYIFIYGDHTPDIDTSDYKQASFTVDNRYFEFVPLFIITPDNKHYKEDKKVASFLDISPTILYSAGIPFEIKSDGQDLLDTAGKTSNPIPFKGGKYDRTYLFDEIKKK
ncbi:MAG: LTA synthase family protein [Clostridiales bacterium]|jgi:phosphoglycerol transferase MdoB-like AlkP superfamily enzyme|nr:LTA synthase family protein [Eubacteriales bacterium]MDH7567674.1 LTA synthase family protein [Clostridiales bacterium]